jgi:hypothetical protein
MIDRLAVKLKSDSNFGVALLAINPMPASRPAYQLHPISHSTFKDAFIVKLQIQSACKFQEKHVSTKEFSRLQSKYESIQESRYS